MPNLSILVLAGPAMAMPDLAASWTNGWRLSNQVVRCELWRLVPALLAGRLLDASLWLLVLCLLPAVALGLHAGHHVNRRLDKPRFLLALHVILLLTGASLLLRSLA